MHLYLHIGYEKTGSTAIQQFFATHADHFRAHGLLYPTALIAEPEFSHRGLTAYAVGADKLHPAHKQCGIFEVEAIEAFRQGFAATLRAELAASNCERVLLSEETCSSWLRTREPVERLYELLAPTCDRITVVFFVRNPIELAESRFGTAIMSGYCGQFPWPLPAAELESLDQHAIAQRWADVFGKDNIEVRHYRRFSGNHDVIDELGPILGLDPARDLGPGLPRAEANLSIGRTALAFLMRFNEIVPAYLAKGRNPMRKNVLHALRCLPDAAPFRLPRPVAEELAKTFRPGLESLISEFLAGDPGGLLDSGSDWRADALDDLSLEVDDAVRIAAHLWAYRK